MSWYNTEGAYAPQLLYTKITYIRNPQSISFGKKANHSDLQALYAKVDSMLSSNGFRKEIFGSSKCELLALCEKQFVTKDFIEGENEKAIYLNEPCNLIIALGGKNLINISSLLSGLSVSESLKIASSAEELLDGEIEFAYDDSLGYLSPCPEDVGAGIEFSSALFLPSAENERNEEYFRQIAYLSGATLTPFTQSNRKSLLYLLKYKPKFKTSDKNASLIFEIIIKKIIDAEKQFSRIIYPTRSKIIIEKAWRAFGILSYARSLEVAELFDLCRDLRTVFSVNLGEEKPPISITGINRLISECQAYSVLSAEKCTNDEECSFARAKIAKAILQKSSLSTELAPRENKGVKDDNG